MHALGYQLPCSVGARAGACRPSHRASQVSISIGGHRRWWDPPPPATGRAPRAHSNPPIAGTHPGPFRCTRAWFSGGSQAHVAAARRWQFPMSCPMATRHRCRRVRRAFSTPASNSTGAGRKLTTCAGHGAPAHRQQGVAAAQKAGRSTTRLLSFWALRKLRALPRARAALVRVQMCRGQPHQTHVPRSREPASRAMSPGGVVDNRNGS